MESECLESRVFSRNSVPSWRWILSVMPSMISPKDLSLHLPKLLCGVLYLWYLHDSSRSLLKCYLITGVFPDFLCLNQAPLHLSLYFALFFPNLFLGKFINMQKTLNNFSVNIPMSTTAFCNLHFTLFALSPISASLYPSNF